MKKVIILGGGLAGLIAAHQLAKKDISCIVIEKKKYPFHRVCGEYVSNEVMPFLKTENLYPLEFLPPTITQFQLSSTSGRTAYLPLDLGGFGISRYNFDNFLYNKAKDSGAQFLLNTRVDDVLFDGDQFTVITGDQEINADLVIGTYGKRSNLDIKWNRDFVLKRSPFVAIKYHVKTEFPKDLIALHNFKGGYCGISNVENGVTNICYMVHREYFRQHSGVAEFEKEVLFKNTLLKYILLNSDRLYDKPLTISEISFQTKSPVENHILMAGDSAGMIVPLCGNGMAMAIQGAKILSEEVLQFCRKPSFARVTLESHYTREWKKHFASRLWVGKQVQRLFGSHIASDFAVNLALYVKPLAKAMIRNSHGEPF